MARFPVIALVILSTPCAVRASATDSYEDVLGDLWSFPAIYTCRSPGDSGATGAARHLLADIGGVKDEATRATLRLYEAECEFTLKRVARAKELADGILKDTSSIDTPEVIRLQQKIELFLAHSMPAAEASREREKIEERLRRLDEMTAKFYRAGWQADSPLVFPRVPFLFLLGRPGAVTTPPTAKQAVSPRHWRTAGRVVPRYDDLSMAGAARMYLEMNMFEDSIRGNRLALGLMVDQHWISGRAARVFPADEGIWETMGDAYAALGQPQKAMACYQKAIASGDELERLAPKTRESRARLGQREAPLPPREKPDAAVLQQIAEFCMGTDLFDEALRAADKASAVAGKPNRVLFGQIYSRKAKTLQECLDAYGPGLNFRGTILSRASVDEARRKAREFGAKVKEDEQRLGPEN